MSRPSVHPVLACLFALLSLLGASATSQGCGGSGGGGGASGGGGNVNAAPGVSAHDLLSAAIYSSLVVEVDYVQGQQPSTSALQLLETRLEERCNKPGGVTIVVDDQVPSGGTVYSVAANKALEAQHRSTFAAGSTAAIYVLYLDGRSDQDANGASVLGWAHGPTSIGIFSESIISASNALVSPAQVEGAVLVHEAGHVLGLVNNGTPMVAAHEDVTHRAHDIDDSCIMHWRIETSNIRDLIINGGSLPTQFDARCVEDLRANGGR